MVRYTVLPEEGVSPSNVHLVERTKLTLRKVTERLRLATTSRKFVKMTDITDQIPHYGQYNHRGEMGEVKRLMDAWGVGEDFGVVVMQSSG